MGIYIYIYIYIYIKVITILSIFLPTLSMFRLASLCAWLSVCLCGLSRSRSICGLSLVGLCLCRVWVHVCLSVWIEEEEARVKQIGSEARKMAVNLFTIPGLTKVNDLSQYSMVWINNFHLISLLNDLSHFHLIYLLRCPQQSYFIAMYSFLHHKWLKETDHWHCCCWNEEMESSLLIPNPGIYINWPASPLLISLNMVHQSFLLKLKLCLLHSLNLLMRPPHLLDLILHLFLSWRFNSIYFEWNSI